MVVHVALVVPIFKVIFVEMGFFISVGMVIFIFMEILVSEEMVIPVKEMVIFLVFVEEIGFFTVEICLSIIFLVLMVIDLCGDGLPCLCGD